MYVTGDLERGRLGGEVAAKSGWSGFEGSGREETGTMGANSTFKNFSCKEKERHTR